VPLLLDEPLLSADPHRRGLGFEFLHQLAATNQVVLTASDPDTAAAMRAVAGDDCSVIHLDADEPVVEARGRRVARVRVL
jgi:ABC-type Mn2+/Zn2+ transport system ATPase subunit